MKHLCAILAVVAIASAALADDPNWVSVNPTQTTVVIVNDDDTDHRQIGASDVPDAVDTPSEPSANNDQAPAPETTFDLKTVSKKPEFPGGEAAMFQWLADHVTYPKAAAKDNASGRVVVRFVVSKTGSIENVKVVRGKHPALDAEAVRLIESMPKWTPGYHNGQPVRVTFSLPITFNPLN